MGRTLKRVPQDFDYPIGKVWEGYLNPYYVECENCDGGWSEEYLYIKNKLYGYVYTPKRELKKFVEEMENLQKGDSFGGNAVYKKIMEKAQELGVEEGWQSCKECKGSGVQKDMQEAYEKWESFDVPKGQGFQLWETTTEGSPKSPVFSTIEDLCAWCEKNTTVFATQTATKEKWYRMLTTDSVEININGNIFYNLEGKHLFSPFLIPHLLDFCK